MNTAPDRRYVIATDVGGTCTDTVVFAPGQPVAIGKALSTPPDFAVGIFDSIRSAADSIGKSVETLISQTRFFVHGSTVVDNTILTRGGAKVGLLTTRGFEDTILITRGAYGRWSGLTEDRIKHPVKTDRAVSLIEPDLIAGLAERIDVNGDVLLPLDDEEAEKAVRFLVEDKGANAIAVSLLWSFSNPCHEQRLKRVVARTAPGIYCTLSSEIAPLSGEYERTSTSIINAYAGQVAFSYLSDLEARLVETAFNGPIMVMQGYGGLLPAQKAADRSVGMLECGPAAGVIGSQSLGELLGQPNVIATDMGGTTFKVSVIQDGEIEFAREPMVDRFHYSVPKIEVVSLGAGGGSIISLDPVTGELKIGPQSAGSRPGPVCYGLGGTEPTLTDVFMLIGYMHPDTFLGGSMTLDPKAARKVFDEKIARPLGMGVEQAAIGIYRIAAAQITDLVRQITVERGLDPREFVLHSFGGSCGMLSTMFGAELAVKQIVVPYTASVNCAFGLVSADIVHQYSATRTLPVSVSPDEINAIYQPMADEAVSQLRSEGFARDLIQLQWSIDMRYARQVHQLTIPVRASEPLDAAGLAQLAGDFEIYYERKYGKGSAYREAGIEMKLFRLTARGLLKKPELQALPDAGSDPTEAIIGRRDIFVDAVGELAPADIYDFEKLKPGNFLEGPAVVHTPITTIVLQAGQRGRVDRFRNITVDL